MTLTELRHEYPHLFYRNQDWFVREKFMSMLPGDAPLRAIRVVRRGGVPTKRDKLPHAVDLAHLYVDSPSDPAWQDYLWTADLDAQGQRVFVGGCANGHGFEIHRHIQLSDRFGIPKCL